MAQQNPQPSLSTIGVLRESFKTTRRNGKLVASILLLVLCYSFPVELGTKLLKISIKEEVTSDRQSSSFEARDAGSFQWANQQIITQTGAGQSVPSTQLDNPNSYSYMDRSTPIGEVRGIRSSQRANPSSYGYMDQHVLRSSQQAKSGSYGYTGQSSAIGEVRGIHSSQRPNHVSYGYEDQSIRMHEVGGIRSSRQANPGSYSSIGQFTPRGEIKVTHSTQRVNPGSYSYMDQFMPIGGVKAIRPILMLELLTLAAFWVILLFLFISTVSSSYEAHTAKVMNLRDVFLKFGESWKRPIHTSFCLTLISFGLFFLLSLFVALIQIFAEGSTAYLLYAILAVSSFLTYLHMAARWMLSLVVSVLESDSSGLKAIVRAGELMKGKKIQASVFMILFHSAMVAVDMASNAMTKKHDRWVKMAITIPFTLGLISFLKLLMFAVYTVYYHDRKMNHKEEGVKELGLYIPVASDEP